MSELLRDFFTSHGIDFFDPFNPPEQYTKKQRSMKFWVKQNDDAIQRRPEWVLLRQYANMCIKIPNCVSRNVHLSSLVEKSDCTPSAKNALQVISDRIVNGQDLTPFMSRQTFKAYVEDALYYNWKIIHFHLNKLNSGSRFSESSGWLLMAFFAENDVFFLDVKRHSERENDINLVWTRQDLITTFCREFPKYAEKYKLKGILASKQGFSDEQIFHLRKRGVVVPPSAEGKVFVLGHGCATNGSSVEVTRVTDLLYNMIQTWQKDLQSQSQSFLLRNINPKNYQFKLGLDNEGFFVFNLPTGQRLPAHCQKVFFRWGRSGGANKT